MKHLKTFETILPVDFKKVVSFDFDGVLHSCVVPHTIHPIHVNEPRKWNPRYEVFDMIKQEAEENKIIIVTARHESNRGILDEFINYFELPIDEIYFTAGKPKYNLLKSLGVIRHYDDNEEMELPLYNYRIEFVLTQPEYMSADAYADFLRYDEDFW